MYTTERLIYGEESEIPLAHAKKNLSRLDSAQNILSGCDHQQETTIGWYLNYGTLIPVCLSCGAQIYGSTNGIVQLLLVVAMNKQQ